ncbi:MAG: AAA family ATPase [Candidatus Thorarchaeota archaeon]|jgi:hypothetical protein
MDDLTSLLLSQATIQDPIRYANIIRATKSDTVTELKNRLSRLREQLSSSEKSFKSASEFRKHVSGDDYARRRKKMKTVFDGLDKQPDNIYRHVDVSVLLMEHYNHLVDLYRGAVHGIELITSANIITFDKAMKDMVEGLSDAESELGSDRTTALIGKLQEAESDMMQSLAVEQRMNTGATTSFMRGIQVLSGVSARYVRFLRGMAQLYEQYYERLRYRHQVEGMEIVQLSGSPSVTLTDVSIMIWENIDKVGEIEGGNSRDEVSAFTLHRANTMLTATKRPEIWSWLLSPGREVLAWAEEVLPMVTALHELSLSMRKMLDQSVWEQSLINVQEEYDKFRDVIDSLDLSQITHKDPEAALTKTERFAIGHRNKSIKKVANLLVYGDGGLQELVDSILKLKIEEHEFFVHENSFYVCKIGTGNMFSGEAPGQLEVIPGEKPYASLDHIWGGGFEEARDFIDGMEDAQKWNPLFLATSPSFSTDKNNMLLVGPQGCGKTQLMRAMGAAKDSVSIFAVGSDFLTCWMGEAQKNPKRLFDQAIKLRKSSKMPVHILIDEIDMVLNDDNTSGSRVNLSLEFQNLMDGMLRRFAKVLVVGELSQEQRVSTLTHYLTHFLPCEDFSDEQWSQWAERFEGAAGDVLRKAVDEVWLRTIRKLIADSPEEAEKIVGFIQEEYGATFDVSDLSDEDRLTIKDMVASHIKVTADVVDASVDHLLDNFAIQQQIQTCRDTYKNAEKLLSRQKRAGKGIGFGE